MAHVPFVGHFSARHPAPDAFRIPPCRTITQGPAYHWFGYYDKLEFCPENRFVLSNEVSFEHRTPRPEDEIKVGMVDTQTDNQWIELGASKAWGWQQGCMLQFRPQSRTEVLWNDRDGDQRYVCRIKDISTGNVRTIDRPVYAVSPDGKFAVTADFSRIQRMRPGYGYVGIPEPHLSDRAPKDSGIWRVDLATGKSHLIFSLQQASEILQPEVDLTRQWNYFNHLLISPDSQRLIALHRWRADRNGKPSGGFSTRMFTLGVDGSQPYLLDPSGHTSHFIWRDARHVCAWTRPRGKAAGFYRFTDLDRECVPVGSGQMTQNGHNTYVPKTDQQWILNDTYPDRQQRMQEPYLYHVPSGRKVSLGRFRSPRQYTGEWRCDTHPRCSRDGRTVAIDSPHNGQGRQVHLIDIGDIIDRT